MNKYEDLENLIFKGFIPLRFRLNNVDFVFKTLSDTEYDYIKIISGFEDDPLYSLKYNLNYIFFSLLFINGENILIARNELYLEIIEILSKYPSGIIKKILDNLGYLLSKANKCIDQIEPYSYENISRYNWSFRKQGLVNDPNFTGFQGTDKLGLNQFQKYWVTLNEREDNKENFEIKYQLAKFLASFTDSKSVKRIDNIDKARAHEEVERRKRIIEEGTEKEKYRLSAPTDTNENLIAELNRQMKGEKDEHDRIIDAHESKMKEKMLQQMQEFNKIKQKSANALPLTESSKVINEEDMKKRIAELKNKPAVSYVNELNEEKTDKYRIMANIKDDDFKGIVTPEEFEMMANKNVSFIEKYQIKQRALAEKYGYDETLFPNL